VVLRKILITGATGFIGHLAGMFRDRYEVAPPSRVELNLLDAEKRPLLPGGAAV